MKHSCLGGIIHILFHERFYLESMVNRALNKIPLPFLLETPAIRDSNSVGESTNINTQWLYQGLHFAAKPTDQTTRDWQIIVRCCQDSVIQISPPFEKKGLRIWSTSCFHQSCDLLGFTQFNTRSKIGYLLNKVAGPAPQGIPLRDATFGIGLQFQKEPQM